jgi:hypothetical protein
MYGARGPGPCVLLASNILLPLLVQKQLVRLMRRKIGVRRRSRTYEERLSINIRLGEGDRQKESNARNRVSWYKKGLLDSILLIWLRLSKIPDRIGTSGLAQTEGQHAGENVAVEEIAGQDKGLGVVGAEGLEALDGLLQGEDDGGRVDIEPVVVCVQVEGGQRVRGVVAWEQRGVVHHHARTGA